MEAETSVPVAPEFLADLYRFARIFYGDGEEALAAVQKALRSLRGKPEARESSRAARYLFARVAREGGRQFDAARWTQSFARASAALRELGGLEPGPRVVAALQICAPLSAGEQALVAGCPPAAFQKMVDRLPGWDREILREELSPTAAEREVLEGWTEGARWAKKVGRRWGDPAGWALSFAFVLLVGLGVWTLLGRADDFPGQIEVARLLQVGSEAKAEDYEPVELPLGSMGDWLALNGVEGFWVPPELARETTVAARVFTHENVRVAAIALPDRQMMVYIFDGRGMGVDQLPEGKWRLFTQGPNAGAVARQGKTVVLAAIRGDAAQLRQDLKPPRPQS